MIKRFCRVLGIYLTLLFFIWNNLFKTVSVFADESAENKYANLLCVVYDNAEIIDIVNNKEISTFIRPLDGYRVSSGFGERWGKMHKGIDLAVAQGTPIVSIASGYVEKMEISNTGYGINIIINHENVDGVILKTRYAHCSSLSKLSVGSYVEQGQVIAYSGNTGDSTGPHLHFEVIKNGIHVNPTSILDF